ncbi:MAG TPA: hypothetical protein PKW98_16135 [Candidatus Wallbacteria bacterium]|nr:hypothetical protein [Candidatus Wallbacteria bacterium]
MSIFKGLAGLAAAVFIWMINTKPITPDPKAQKDDQEFEQNERDTNNLRR